MNFLLDLLDDHLPWVVFGGAVLLVLGLTWLGIASDRAECEETGMHSVCKDWSHINNAPICMHSEREPCDP